MCLLWHEKVRVYFVIRSKQTYDKHLMVLPLKFVYYIISIQNYRSSIKMRMTHIRRRHNRISITTGLLVIDKNKQCHIQKHNIQTPMSKESDYTGRCFTWCISLYLMRINMAIFCVYSSPDVLSMQRMWHGKTADRLDCMKAITTYSRYTFRWYFQFYVRDCVHQYNTILNHTG